MFTVAVRRLRIESVGVAIALAGVGMLALVTGSMMQDQYRSSGLADCMAAGTGADCQQLIDRFGERFSALQLLIVPLVLLPALLGAFIGAPLVAREIEAGTHRFLWTQSVTRRRWFVTVAAAAVLLAAIAGTVYAVIAGLWLDTTNAVTDERLGRLYDLQGIVPAAAGVFAVATGLASGVLLRRTVPAMAATIAIFVAVRLSIGSQVRPRLAPAQTLDVAFDGPDPLSGTGAWVLSDRTLTASGRELGTGGSLNLGNLGDLCPGLVVGVDRFPDRSVVDQCLADLGVHQIIRYHPADRFWTFQLIESGLLLGLAAAAFGVAVWGLTRRAT
jgi:hypothetical protein